MKSVILIYQLNAILELISVVTFYVHCMFSVFSVCHHVLFLKVVYFKPCHQILTQIMFKPQCEFECLWRTHHLTQVDCLKIKILSTSIFIITILLCQPVFDKFVDVCPVVLANNGSSLTVERCFDQILLFLHPDLTKHANFRKKN